VDSAAGQREGVAKNESVASRGVDEMEHGHHHGTGTGVTPAATQPAATQPAVTHTGHTTSDLHARR
jgi:hypothetical protein